LLFSEGGRLGKKGHHKEQNKAECPLFCNTAVVKGGFFFLLYEGNIKPGLCTYSQDFNCGLA